MSLLSAVFRRPSPEDIDDCPSADLLSKCAGLWLDNNIASFCSAFAGPNRGRLRTATVLPTRTMIHVKAATANIITSCVFPFKSSLSSLPWLVGRLACSELQQTGKVTTYS